MKNLFKNISYPFIIIVALITSLPINAASSPKKPECFAPAKPGGGFDISCRVAATGLEQAKLINRPMPVTFVPGGVGAVAINQMVGPKRKDGNIITAFSSGSLLAIATHKFGNHINADSVKWVASIGADYGVIMVLQDSPLNNLQDLIDAIKKDPASLAFGAGGPVGSQDWTKAALIFKAAGADPKKMRYLAFEGGGESIASLLGKHIDVYPGDASELEEHLKGNQFKVLAVLSKQRLVGNLANYPTALEQGYDIDWTIVRGFYMAPQAPEQNYQFYVNAFETLYKDPNFIKMQQDKGLLPFEMSGDKFSAYIKERITFYAKLSKEFGLQ